MKCLLVGKNWRYWADLAKELRIDEWVVFTGFRRDVPDVLRLFDIYVLPSRDEGLGTSILEAMAVRLPVIVSNVGGIPEVVTRETGITVPARSPAKLAEAMKDLIEDQKKRVEMGRAASKRIQEDFSLRRFVTSTVDLYEYLMKKNHKKTD